MELKKNMSGVVNKVSNLSSVVMARVLISEVSQKHGQSFKTIILSGYSTRVFSVCLHLLSWTIINRRNQNTIRWPSMRNILDGDSDPISLKIRIWNRNFLNLWYHYLLSIFNIQNSQKLLENKMLDTKSWKNTCFEIWNSL